ncbi:hypothetical protein BCR42DRAFT_113800 [Absidia repens]|uniref:Rap-GAP domain-containing protein n=1 Tax=Absidia repens TaxID=90262 RepID=A0A1X2I619_9FUNG|nr:hypothetical protein BCR42DRAFT_113800 [Absidia repens]
MYCYTNGLWRVMAGPSSSQYSLVSPVFLWKGLYNDICPIGKGGQPDSKSLYAIITAIQESTPLNGHLNHDAVTNNDIDNSNNDIKNKPSQYRIIVRHPKHATGRYIVSNTQAHNYLTKKDEYTFGKNGPQKPIKQQRRSIRSPQNLNTFSSQQYNLMTAAILSVRPELDMDNAIHLSATTITTCNLEKELTRLDGIEIPRFYKFGVLTIKENQTKEEEWFSNTGLAPPFDQFLKVLGTRIQLKGYKGYAAGLDTRTGETGDTSVISCWSNHEIMFHVASLMPLHQNDKQQVQRKRYIGNDIVCLIFLEDNAIFDPKSIRSKFLHVYIVVRLETISNKHRWRIEIVRKSNVPDFGPSLPNPPLFYDDEALQKFLTLKLISAENAALKCDNFSIPNNRARAGILEGMIEKGLNHEELSSSSSSSPPRSSSSATSKLGSALMERQQSQPQRRPKSSSGDRRSRSSLRSIRSNPDNGTGGLPSFQFSNNNNNNNAQQPMDPVVPPVPSPTRSTMLQDLKRFALRRAPTLSSLQHRSATVKEEEPITPPDDNDAIDDHPKKQPQYTNSLPSSTTFHQGGDPNVIGEPMIQRSFLASKARTPFFKSAIASTTTTTDTVTEAPRPTATATTSQVPSFPQTEGLRYKTQNLMINVVAKRTSPRPVVTPLTE